MQAFPERTTLKSLHITDAQFYVRRVIDAFTLTTEMLCLGAAFGGFGGMFGVGGGIVAIPIFVLLFHVD